MSVMNFGSDPGSHNLLARARRTEPQGALLAANTRAQTELTWTADPACQDVRGQTLRLLRMQQSIDPVVLATQACISLRQLHQLESGETSLFYSPGLRNQAGRRVATLLGANWDDLGQTPPPSAHQDKPLRLVTSTEAVAEPVSTPNHAPRPPQDATLSGFAHRLQKPATDTLVVEAPATAKLTRPDEPEHRPPATTTHPLWTLVGWILSGLAGYGSVELFYRFGS